MRIVHQVQRKSLNPISRTRSLQNGQQKGSGVIQQLQDKTAEYVCACGSLKLKLECAIILIAISCKIQLSTILLGT